VGQWISIFQHISMDCKTSRRTGTGSTVTRESSPRFQGLFGTLTWLFTAAQFLSHIQAATLINAKLRSRSLQTARGLGHTLTGRWYGKVTREQLTGFVRLEVSQVVNRSPVCCRDEASHGGFSTWINCMRTLCTNSFEWKKVARKGFKRVNLKRVYSR
jgi:hypothetical protein